MGRSRVRSVAVFAMAMLVAGVGAPAKGTSSTQPAGPGVPWQPGPAVYQVGLRSDVEVRMDDGVVLRVDVRYPVEPATGRPAEGPFPSLLTQTPYGKKSSLIGGLDASAEKYLVARGYIAVTADVRGRGASEGLADLWSARESRDGVALAEWAATLPNSNGRVGLFGASYMGITQLLTAAAAGPHSAIAAAVPEVAVNNAVRDALYGGMGNLGFGLLYSALFPATGVDGNLAYVEPEDPFGFASRALLTSATSADFSANLLGDFLLGGPRLHSDFWDARAPGTTIAHVAANGIPTMLVGGWYDVMGIGPTRNYVGLQNAASGRSPELAMLPDQPTDGRFQLTVGPWTHVIPSAATDEIRLRWFDRWLKDIDNGVDRTRTPIHFNILGTDRWVDAGSWPLAEADSTPLYLGPPGHSGAISLNDGQLSATRAAADTGSDSLAWTGLSSPCSARMYVQTVGILDRTGVPVSQLCGTGSDLSTEAGALTYTTEPFESATVVAGPIGATLYASSTTADAEFILAVERVHTDGTPESITSGALLGSLRASDPARDWTDRNGNPIQPFRHFSAGSEQPLTPGQIIRFDLSTWPTAFQINPGERLRITISSSDAPFATPTLAQIASLVGGTYDIQRTRLHPSSVTVPFVDPHAFHSECSICTFPWTTGGLPYRSAVKPKPPWRKR